MEILVSDTIIVAVTGMIAALVGRVILKSIEEHEKREEQVFELLSDHVNALSSRMDHILDKMGLPPFQREDKNE
jgi:tetrahydromethanopterin S-methyltransferase subunit B